MSGVVTVPELLDGHTVLDIECLDRLYLNGYVPKLQVGGQVVTFLHDHRGMPIVSPAVFEQIGTRFRQAVARFAENSSSMPMMKFEGMRKAGVVGAGCYRHHPAGRAGRAWWRSAGRRAFQLWWTTAKLATPNTDPAPAVLLGQARAPRDLLLASPVVLFDGFLWWAKG